MEDVYYADGGHYIEHALTFEDNTMPDGRQSQEFAAKSHKYGQRRSSPQHGRVAHDRSSVDWRGKTETGTRMLGMDHKAPLHCCNFTRQPCLPTVCTALSRRCLRH